MISVPLVDLYAQYQTIQGELDEAIADVIKKSQFIRGPKVSEFEAQFAEAVGRKNCISCANGTDALYIAFKCLGLKPGDEVLAPAHSWISTTATITQAGGTVVFCDTKRDLFTIDPEEIEAKISPNTVGIVPVHLFGQSADMRPIMEIAQKHNLWVVEDCAQAHMAQYRGQQVGTFGDAATFSFYPGKNLGAMGDAGAITTDHQGLANAMQMFARHGGLKKGDHVIEGINSRMDGLQAAILSIKLRHLPSWTQARQQRAERYSRLLDVVEPIDIPIVDNKCDHAWHLYVIRSEKRDELASYLKAHGVDTVVNYPTALPFLPAYERYCFKPEDFPNAHYNQSRILSLPLFPEMTDEQQDRVVGLIKAFYQ